METYPWALNSAELNEELLASLRRFLTLYDQRRNVFREAAECLRRGGGSERRAATDSLAVALLGLLRGPLGATVGGVSGGLWGVTGAVGAAAYSRMYGHVNVMEASIGFLGGAFGGLVGGALSGSVAGEAEVTFVASGRRFGGVASTVLWISLGSVSGGTIGSIYGGSIGAAGGALGGGLGALHARALVIYMMSNSINRPSEGKGSSDTVETLQTSVKPLVEELLAIQKVLAQMKFSYMTVDITEQTAKTLAALRSLEEALSGCQEAADPPRSAPCWQDGAKLCSEALEELKKMKAEVDKILEMFQ
ncbi:keratin, type II cytoskeletal 1-like [Salarias fasciatus]|uniref:keratin, type II cytoskeletal 1-like n=1 Tax=Salarias fasciatus TaxID=181472 RepID=UPI001176B061|nr:keratin, type II cytoskeletal 1-like [Salarias fasciatus]